MYNDKVLLGTFILGSGVSKNIIRNILEAFKTNKLFVFSFSADGKAKFLVTFNIDKKNLGNITKFKEEYKNTTQLHRNKDTNTLYTINSLNEVIKLQSKSSKPDKSFEINWKDYQNSLVYLNNKQLSSAKIRLVQIINI
jgi:hypothetical protein